jgi:hypothetical protein
MSLVVANPDELLARHDEHAMDLRVAHVVGPIVTNVSEERVHR